MNRRDFFKSLAFYSGVIATSQIPEFARGEIKRTALFSAMDLREIMIPVGIPVPFQALHISDTHLVRVDKRDDELKRYLASRRYTVYPWGEHFLNTSIAYAKQNNLMLIHTGDIYDFITEANLDLTASYFNENEWLTAVGNHEFNIYLHEARHDAAYKAKSLDMVQGAYPNNIINCAKVQNGINFVSIDNSYYNVTEEQHAFVENEMKKGLPVILLTHIPFYTPEHCTRNISRERPSVSLCGAPREITDRFTAIKKPVYSDNEPNAEWRRISVNQRADDATLDFCKWLKEQKNLKGILSGHCHHYHIERFSPTALQYTVGANYKGAGYVINFT